jgi:malonyl-CoA/methylmalonyl-CoA synthetase
MTLLNLFNLSFINRRNSVGLEFDSKVYGFAEIDARSNAMARVLLQRGIVAGDRLCVYLANSVEMVDIFLACVKTGVIFVPINILYRQRETEHIVADAGPRAVVAAETFPSACPKDVFLWRPDELEEEAIQQPSQALNIALDGDAPAAIVYTSGTTGTSKGAILTHNNFAANALNLLTCWQITADDRLLLPLPLFHVHGLGNGLICWLISGCRMRLLQRFEHARAREIFSVFAPTLFFGVPTIYVRLLELPEDHAAQIGASLRLFVSGSAPLPAHVLEKFRQRFGHTILERYGMTETLMNMSNPYVGERRAGTVGIPLPGVSVRLLDASGKRVPDGETGELYIKGPNVFSGYWLRNEATRAAFVDGYFRTGDLAVRSMDGYFTLRGRLTDLIISGGFNIYPREIEEFLLEHPEVAEAAVVGVPNAVRGELPVAYLVLRTDLDVKELERRCQASLASFKVPRAFIVVDRLPRTALGKIQKQLLPPCEASEGV